MLLLRKVTRKRIEIPCDEGEDLRDTKKVSTWICVSGGTDKSPLHQTS